MASQHESPESKLLQQVKRASLEQERKGTLLSRAVNELEDVSHHASEAVTVVESCLRHIGIDVTTSLVKTLRDVEEKCHFAIDSFGNFTTSSATRAKADDHYREHLEKRIEHLISQCDQQQKNQTDLLHRFDEAQAMIRWMRTYVFTVMSERIAWREKHGNNPAELAGETLFIRRCQDLLRQSSAAEGNSDGSPMDDGLPRAGVDQVRLGESAGALSRVSSVDNNDTIVERYLCRIEGHVAGGRGPRHVSTRSELALLRELLQLGNVKDGVLDQVEAVSTQLIQQRERHRQQLESMRASCAFSIRGLRSELADVRSAATALAVALRQQIPELSEKVAATVTSMNLVPRTLLNQRAGKLAKPVSAVKQAGTQTDAAPSSPSEKRFSFAATPLVVPTATTLRDDPTKPAPDASRQPITSTEVVIGTSDGAMSESPKATANPTRNRAVEEGSKETTSAAAPEAVPRRRSKQEEPIGAPTTQRAMSNQTLQQQLPEEPQPSLPTTCKNDAKQRVACLIQDQEKTKKAASVDHTHAVQPEGQQPLRKPSDMAQRRSSQQSTESPSCVPGAKEPNVAVPSPSPSSSSCSSSSSSSASAFSQASSPSLASSARSLSESAAVAPPKTTQKKDDGDASALHVDAPKIKRGKTAEAEIVGATHTAATVQSHGLNHETVVADPSHRDQALPGPSRPYGGTVKYDHETIDVQKQFNHRFDSIVLSMENPNLQRPVTHVEAQGRRIGMLNEKVTRALERMDSLESGAKRLHNIRTESASREKRLQRELAVLGRATTSVRPNTSRPATGITRMRDTQRVADQTQQVRCTNALEPRRPQTCRGQTVAANNTAAASNPSGAQGRSGGAKRQDTTEFDQWIKHRISEQYEQPAQEEQDV